MVFYLWYRFFPCLERNKCLQEHTQQVKAWELSFSMCRETYNRGMIATIKLLVVTLLLLLAALLHSKYWRLMLHLPTHTSNIIKAFSYQCWTANHQFTGSVSLDFTLYWTILPQGVFTPKLEQYIGQCMGINNGIEEPTGEYQNCNTSQIMIFGGYVEVRGTLFIIWNNAILIQVWWRFHAWYIDPNGI